ncbi:penicillin-binding protein [Clostridium algoriphilum]|uniref:penicillin-binding transpeptidase domain-containing protein n=1 Tax=Clostridium algoriphilum TaxID=198347 RepID=UPI001CF1AA81|nr:penicillin-binding transpeptidase domain-containing protein [Clostridium algoriphilum]MCB2292519.1 penicillin-binding protein [Clostridium algoriphilum]
MSKRNKNDKKFSRFNTLAVIMILIFSVIVLRLVNIQVINGEVYKETANQQNHKIISTPAPRGEIVDRNGAKLATSMQSYTLIFTKTTESEASLIPTLDKVLKILDDNKQTLVDDFLLGVNTEKNKTEYKFNFKTTDKSSQNWLELRFKKDRGFEEKVIKNIYKDKKKDDLTEAQLKKVDELLLKITPEQVFNQLVVQYGLDKIKNSKSKVDLRRYMVVEDNIKMQSFSGYKPVVIASNLSKDASFIIEQRQPEIPGISVVVQPIRYYPNKDLGSAFLGYISKINPWDKNKYEEKGYDISSDYIGTAGIESTFEDVLKGTKGQESISVNKQGRKVSSLGQIETYPGQTVQLNIDKDMQYAAERSLDAVLVSLQKKGKVKDVDMTNATRGAVVAMDVKTGKILALASRPGYDPNIFSRGITSDEYDKIFGPVTEKMGLDYIRKRNLVNVKGILTDKEMTKSKAEKEKILLDYMFPVDKSAQGETTIRKDNNDIFPKATFNYATKSLIPPGSSFKPLTAIAGLEEGVITETSTVYDGGPYNKRYQTVTAACWIYNDTGNGHGIVNIQRAMRESCNYYFYDVADKLYAHGGENQTGLDLLAKYAWKFGLGIEPKSNKKPATGIEIPENYGQVYNYESSKEILASIHVSNLVGNLQKGSNSYKPLDLESQKESGTKEEISNIVKLNKNKVKFIAEIKTQMKKDKKGYVNTILLKEFINASSVLKSNNYTDKEIKSMTGTVNSEIGDASVEINSAANAYYAAIGQGFDAFTPLQLTNYVSTMVNGGNRYELHLVDKTLDPDGNVIKETKPVVLEKTNISANTIRIIKEGMLEVTSNPNGTAYSVFGDFAIQSGGKTGSGTFNDLTQSALGRTSYGYYIGFAPYDKPEIAICAVVFDGGHGAYVAPIAKSVYEQYFKVAILKKDAKYKFMVNPDEKTSDIDLNNATTGNSHD